jgi:Phage tail sheath protein subtilisin-like domain/Phage tail sheath C-terminal domain
VAETTIPGVYITVLSEGLISAGRIATGRVGVVGTAAGGPVGQAVTLGGFREALDVFGPSDDAAPGPSGHPLTLTRSLQLLYGNGATDVVAVRVASADAAAATLDLRDPDDHLVATLTALSPGSRGNEVHVQCLAAAAPSTVEETLASAFDRLSAARVVASPQNRFRLRRGVSRRTEQLSAVYRVVVEGERVHPDAAGRYFLATDRVVEAPSVNLVEVRSAAGASVRRFGEGAILYGAGATPPADQLRLDTDSGELVFEAGQRPTSGETVVATYATEHDPPTAGQVLVTTWDGSLQFAGGAGPDAASGDQLEASYLVDQRDSVLVRLSRSGTTEEYTGPSARTLAAAVTSRSRMVTATADATHGDARPVVPTDAYLGSGSSTPGANGADAGAAEYATGLAALENLLVNVVVAAGQDAGAVGSVLLDHLAATEQTEHERIGVIGAAGTTVEDFLGHTMASDRVVLVAPGIVDANGAVLPPAYTAAAVAGLLAGLDVQTSLTNKALNVPGLALALNRGQQAQLVARNVLAVVANNGFRIVQGVTTQGVGQPFAAIPTRRIVDYARYGVRSAASPYIGRLNNERVRAALQATLDAFLTRMVQSEALTAYQLEVTATRQQEISGEVSVTMTIQPTFSIEFILVQMILR